MKIDFQKMTQFVLMKQHLLSGHKAADVLRATRDVVGLHATNSTTPYLSLFARVRNFEKKHFDIELYHTRNLVRTECMRSTLFIVPKETIPILYQIYKAEFTDKLLIDWRISTQEYKDMSNLILEMLKGKIMTASQIKRLLPENVQRTLTRKVGKNLVRITNVNLVLIWMTQQGILLSMKQPGTWKIAGLNCYSRFIDWFPDINLNQVSRDKAMIQLVKAYVQSYGPVTKKDIHWWSGLKPSEVEHIIEMLKSQLAECEVSGLDSKFIMLQSDALRLKQFKPSKRHSISFLPYEDSFLKGYNDRERLVSKEQYHKVYHHGEASPSILIDGQVAGTWQLETQEGKSKLTFQLFERTNTTLHKSIRNEAKALSTFAFGDNVQIKEA